MSFPAAERGRWAVRLALSLAAWLSVWIGLVAPGPAFATSLRFFGSGVDDIDRVKIRIDNPARPADVGATDFTLEWWMRAMPGENASDAVGCDANDGWIYGNIMLDRDVYFDGDHGDFGVSLTGGRIAFGVGAGSSGNTICGTADVADNTWHHVAVTRRRSDGRLRIYVDGVLDAEGPGNVGNDRNVSYRDGRTTSFPNSDPFLVIGAEKHDAGPDFPSYRGWIDEVRLSRVQRYTGTSFTRPFGPFVPDGDTAALYHLDEGSGDVVGDASGGGSHGTRQIGGSPNGPQWSSETPPLDTTRRVALEQVVSGLARPVAIAHAGDDRLFVVEAAGQILVYTVNPDGSLTPEGTFLDIHELVACCGERGLLGLAFHPSYATNGYFFVYYTSEAGNGDVVVARYRAPSAGSNVADPDSARILLTIPHSTYSNHNGGGLAFGPEPEGYLYVSVGDGGGGGDPLGSGQSLTTLLGKVLRLQVNVSGDSPPFYTIPADNPFVGQPPFLPEIWAWGLRNPWRIAFDRLSGDFFIADVGQGAWEEVSFQPASSPGGENYGWRRMEGSACYNPGSGCQTGSLVLPVLEYGHGEGCSITGGYRYRGSAVPTLHGGYLFGDFCSGTIWIGEQLGSGAWLRTVLLDTGLKISSFGEDAAGEIYVADLNGAIYRVAQERPRLTVTRAGSGTGTVTADSGGLACAPTCSAAYDPGTTVTLTATASADSWFAGWAGACGGTGSCVVEMDGDRAVTATFNPSPVLQFSAPNYTVSEGTANATITVQRLVTTAGTVTVNYALTAGSAVAPPAADADFGGPGGSLTGTLTFLPGQASKTLLVPIVDDTEAEGPETVLLSLHNPTAGAVLGAQPTAVLTILNHDDPGAFRFSQSAYGASEGSASTLITVLRSSTSAVGTVRWTIVPEGTTAAHGADFDTPNGQLTGTLPFPANVSSQTLLVTLLRQDDTLADGPRTIRFALSEPGPAAFASLAAPTTATLTVTDNDSAGSLQFSPASLTVSETAGQAVVTVTRSQKASGVTVDWAVTGGTAIANTDYGGPTSGTLTFGADVLGQTITLPLLNPAGAQSSRTVQLTLSNPLGGAALGAAKTATVTITDDEVGVRFGQAAYTVSEGSGSAGITVLRTGPTNEAVTVNYATGDGADTATPALTPGACSGGADYRPISAGSLTFNPGETSKTITVMLCGDSAEEGAETLRLRLTGVSPNAHVGSPSMAVVTIQENDEGGVLKWSAATYSASEGAGQAVLTVSRSGGSAGSVTVGYVIAGGTATAGADFNGLAPSGSLTGTLEFAANVKSRTLTIPLVNDTEIEPNETFTVTLQNAQGGAAVGSPVVATVTITDNDRTGTVQFSSPTASAPEDVSVTLTVRRSGSTSAPASVAYEITGDTAAVNGSLTGTVTIPGRKSSQPLTIPLNPDSVWDGNSTLTVTLKEPLTGGVALGTPNPATVTLVDDEGTVQFAGAVFTVSEGSGSATITVTRTGGTAQPVTVTYATGDPGDTASPAPTPSACSAGADYRSIPSGSLTFSPGQPSKTFTVSLCGDSVEDGSESLTLRLTGVSLPAQLGAQSTALLTIQENDEGGLLRFSSANYAVSEGTSTATLTVTRPSNLAGDVTVPWILSNGTGVHGIDWSGPQSGILTFAAGQTSASFPVTISNDADPEAPRTVLAQLGTPTGGATLGSPSTATLTINDNEPTVRFSSAAYTVSESSTGTSDAVWREGPTNSQVSVTVQSTAAGSAEAGGCAGGGDYTAVSTSVTFLPGETSKSVPVTLCPDGAADGTETIALTLASPVGATLGTPNTATVTITEDDFAGTIQFAAAAVSVSEAQGTARVRVTRTGGSASGVTVHWTVTGGTATAPADYTGPASGWLTFGSSGAGATSQDVEIPIVDRDGAQGPRTITLLLDATGGNGSLGLQTTATLWILDAD